MSDTPEDLAQLDREHRLTHPQNVAGCAWCEYLQDEAAEYLQDETPE